MDYSSVLDFWFGIDHGEPREVREFWFRKSDETDNEIRTRFGAAVSEALAGNLEYWAATPRGALGLILLLDQFTRNIFRGTPRAFAGDEAALARARRLVYTGLDRRLDPVERWFVYLPYEHSEQLIDQYESLRLYRGLAASGAPEPLEWAQKHFDVIRRFGRFPHRNEILGRESTIEEVEFLRQPGSRF